MGDTYLNLVNNVLERLNEVPLSADNFNIARGLHRAVKSAVKDTVQKINKNPFQWTFTATEIIVPLVKGQTEYNWPADFKNADWESFQIIKDNSLNVNTRSLVKINRDHWYNFHKSNDDDAGVDGRNIPVYVFEGHGQKFGVSPSPNELYTIKYRYYSNQAELVNATDVCNIPNEYNYVITAGALHLMKIFKEDLDGANVMESHFKSGLSEMRNLLLNRVDRLEDTRVPVNSRSRGFF